MRIFQLFLYTIFLLTLLGSCKYMETSYLEGRVFTIQNRDTLFLDSVQVDFYNTEKYGGTATNYSWASQDFRYTTATKSDGVYRFTFKYGTAASVYELTFRRKGYIFASEQLNIAYNDLEEGIVLNQNLQSGIFKDQFYMRHQKIETDEAGMLYFSVIGGVIFFFLLALVIRFGERVNIYIQDLLRNK